MIELGDEIVLVGDGSHIHIEGLNAIHDRRSRWRNRPQRQIRLNRRDGQGAFRGIRHINCAGTLLALTESFVGNEEKGSVFHDGGSAGAAKLNTAEWGNLRSVKVVARIENAVAVKEES